MYIMLTFVKGREEYYIYLYFQKESETTVGREQGWKVVIFG